MLAVFKVCIGSYYSSCLCLSYWYIFILVFLVIFNIIVDTTTEFCSHYVIFIQQAWSSFFHSQCCSWYCSIHLSECYSYDWFISTAPPLLTFPHSSSPLLTTPPHCSSPHRSRYLLLTPSSVAQYGWTHIGFLYSAESYGSDGMLREESSECRAEWGGVRTSEDEWGGVRRSEEEWGGVRRSEEEWGGVRRSEEEWGGVRRSEEEWGGVRRSAEG